MWKRKRKDFLAEFNRVKQSIQNGTTPVYCELRSAKTQFIELLPSLLIQSVFLVISTLIVQAIHVSELFSIVILLVMNTTSETLSSIIFVCLKHLFRIRKLKKYELEANEENIAVLECMEYQSV